MGNKNSSLLRLVEERALSMEEKKRQQEALVPYLHKDCISNILGRLPLDNLQRSRESLYRSPMASIPPEKPNTVSVETKFLQSACVPVLGQPNMDPNMKSYIKFLEISGEKSEVGEYNVRCLGNIRARKLIALPLGTLYPPHDESYGFALSNITREYKVVRLFRDELGCLGCEILILGTRVWRGVNGPSVGLVGWFAIGALHWVPHIDDSDYIVSMDVDTEKFHTVPLPKSSRTHDGIVEMGGFLSFVTHAELNQIEVWILKGIGESWTKQHSIITGSVVDMVP
ncbi:hypothetical protein CJ030_MR3G001095 [Morella rubra]|uniref:F-box associated beta-propeller type 3 domain-containing protein n=1 Tax=Morella rubra TaxID=262757 RepID=A0A6A1W2H7_9ROSI|nr:hypothetical protein CJ030_MR3G001095 [Morella rubra]